MSTLAERFDLWTPNADEATAPDNAWFYRAFDCLRDEWPVEVERWNGLFHNAICWGHGELKPVIQSLVNAIGKMQDPPHVTQRYCSDYEPVLKDGAAFEIFTVQFKRKWPRKRLNSKFANEKWMEVQEKAMEIAQAELDAEHKEWEEREEKRNAEYSRKVAEWQAKVDEIVALRGFALRLNHSIKALSGNTKNALNPIPTKEQSQ